MASVADSAFFARSRYRLLKPYLRLSQYVLTVRESGVFAHAIVRFGLSALVHPS